jgi:hypothetical protein
MWFPAIVAFGNAFQSAAAGGGFTVQFREKEISQLHDALQ